MLVMRLQRIGRKNDASFRVVVTDSRRGPKSGKHTDLIGSYNPKTNALQIKAERVLYWLAHGVQTSDTVHNLLVREGVIQGKKRNVLPKKMQVAVGEVAAEAADAPVDSADAGAETAGEEAGDTAPEPAPEVSPESGGASVGQEQAEADAETEQTTDAETPVAEAASESEKQPA